VRLPDIAPLLRASVFPCVAIALLAMAGGAFAEEETEKRDELSQVREHIKSTRKSRDELASRKNALDEQLGEIERNYGRLAKQIKDLEAEARTRSRRLDELQRQQSGLLSSMQHQRRILAEQARAAYAVGRQDWLKLMLNQEDPSRLTRVLAYYRYLNHARSALLQGMEQDLTAARRLQDELSAEEERLKVTRRQVAKEQAALEESKRARRGLLAELKHELRDKDAELNRLQEDEQRLQDVLTSIQLSGREGSSTGNPSAANPLPATPETHPTCPVAGRLVGQFGSPRMNGRWDGILIAAEEGTPVRAVSSGRVAFADWLRGYGLLIIVDHGNGIMSLYAFSQSLYKNVGDPVSAGDIIATVGASGGHPEPGLYFGIREQGRAVDPMPWCSHTE
jgi:septal ring factor EnvC (AmiA/AmiB activator)